MIKRLKPQSEFARNVLTLMTGTTIAQAIPIAIAPILTRIYSPEDFGILAFFTALVTILGAVANGRYEMAIMLPESDEDAINIAALGLIIAAIFSFIVFVAILVFESAIVSSVGNSEIEIWLMFIPFVVMMIGTLNVFNYLNTRKKQYKEIAHASVYRAVASASVQLSVGAVKAGAFGLISGQILSHIVANYFQIMAATREFSFSIVDRKGILLQAKRYINFPKFSMPAALVSAFNGNLPTIVLPMAYGLSLSGFFFLAYKILAMPVQIAGKSISNVFFQKISSEKDQISEHVSVVQKKLAIISAPFFVLLFIVLPDLFAFVFGEDWREAGVIAQILTPVLFFQFINFPTGNVMITMEKQKESLFWQSVMLLMKVVALGLMFIIEDYKVGIAIYSFVSVLGYVVFSYVNNYHAGVSSSVYVKHVLLEFFIAAFLLSLYTLITNIFSYGAVNFLIVFITFYYVYRFKVARLF